MVVDTDAKLVALVVYVDEDETELERVESTSAGAVTVIKLVAVLVMTAPEDVDDMVFEEPVGNIVPNAGPEADTASILVAVEALGSGEAEVTVTVIVRSLVVCHDHVTLLVSVDVYVALESDVNTEAKVEEAPIADLVFDVVAEASSETVELSDVVSEDFIIDDSEFG